MTQKRPKWDLASTINAGTNTYELGTKYHEEINARLQPGELEELVKQVKVLDALRSGQQEVLASQKGKTGTQDETARLLHTVVMELRQMVQTATDDAGIRKTFGVGENTHADSISSVKASANMILDGYDKFTEWANNEAGIIDADMDEVAGLLMELTAADEEQEVSKLTRKLTTMDKDVLQRLVEDKITKISSIVVRVFGRKDPAVAKLFKDLIPNSN
ncbi:MAG: hypothetical protein JXB49_19730 [Bacteroidales bacterium]|nr:hypothetical protein [Bacteroidales bacterium]